MEAEGRTIKKKHSPKVLWLLLVLALYASHFYAFSGWNYTLMGRFSYLVYGGIFISAVYVVYMRRKMMLSLPFSKIILLLTFLPLTSFIGKMFAFGEGPFSEVNSYVPLMTFLLFYIFWAFRIKEKQIILTMTVFTIGALTIQIVQQLIPDSSLFGIFSENDSQFYYTKGVAEIRNGLYRFRLECYSFAVLLMFYYWQKIISRPATKTILLFLMSALSMYLYLTRQVLLSSILVLGLSLFMTSGKKNKSRMIIVIVVFAVILVANAGALFGGLIDQTQTQANKTGDVRLLTYPFFLNEIISSPFVFLFGAGHPSVLEDWQDMYHFFSTDIGFVGEIFTYGIGWFVLYLVTVYLVLVRYRKAIPLYVKMYFLYALFISPMIFPYTSNLNYILWTILLYLSSVYVLRYRYALKASRGKRKSNN